MGNSQLKIEHITLLVDRIIGDGLKRYKAGNDFFFYKKLYTGKYFYKNTIT